MAMKDEPVTNDGPVVIERTLDAPVETVWKAISDRDQMKHWFFDIKDFKPEVGCEFRFTGGTEEHQYLHMCRVVEVVRPKKLRYSWRYDGYAGNSFVTFDLFAEGNRTRVKITHEGLETFPADNPDFAKGNFADGWTSLLGSSLREFVEATSRSDTPIA